MGVHRHQGTTLSARNPWCVRDFWHMCNPRHTQSLYARRPIVMSRVLLGTCKASCKGREFAMLARLSARAWMHAGLVQPRVDSSEVALFIFSSFTECVWETRASRHACSWACWRLGCACLEGAHSLVCPPWHLLLGTCP